MRRRTLAALSVAAVSIATGAGIFGLASASALQPNPLGIGLKPVLGWSSWSALRMNPTAAQVEAEANAMVSTGLHAAGYDYIDLDDFYYQCPGSQGPNVDQWGRWVTNPTIFPPNGSEDGIAVLAAYVHSLGLKFGIYLTPGISKQGVAASSPVEATGPGGVELGTASGYNGGDYNATTNPEGIATTSSAENYNCGGMVRLDWTDNPAGAQAYYDSIADRFASWGVDLIKFDGQEDYSGPDLDGFAAAIAQSSNPHMLLDATEGDFTIALQPTVDKDATQWEYSPDIESGGGATAYTNYSNVTVRFNNVVLWQPFVGPGEFQDLDSVEIGNGSSPGIGGREDGLTVDGRKTMLALWSLASSPLILGPDLTNMDPTDLALLTNPDVLAVDQDGIPAGRIGGGTYTAGVTKYQVFSKLETGGNGYVGLFNTTSAAPEVVSTTASAMGMPASATGYLLTDLWAHTTTETAGTIASTVPAQGAGLYRVTATNNAAQAPPSTTLGLSQPATFTPGQSQTVTETFTNNGVQAATGVQLSLSGPAGWTVTPTSSASFASVGSGQSVATTFTAVAQSTTGNATLTGTSTYGYQGGSTQTATTTVAVRVAYPIKINELRTGVTGATTNQFIELYNAGSLPVDVSGWSVVYRSATATTNTTLDVMPGATNAGITVIPGGGYYLLGRSGGYTGPPAANQTFTTSMSSSGGAVGVLDATGNLVVDSVGYGPASNSLVEGCPAPAPGTATSPGKSIIRWPNGFDSDNNCTDFVVTTVPTPGAANIEGVSGTSSPGASVTSTLSLSIPSVTPSFGTFVPGVAANYTTTAAATVVSTAQSATLSANDPSSSFPGHLVNTAAAGGPYDLPKGLQVAASDVANTMGSGIYTDLSVTNPATLLTYLAPVSNDAVTLWFQQPIGSTDPLRTGSYTKTITFTLSTTTP